MLKTSFAHYATAALLSLSALSLLPATASADILVKHEQGELTLEATPEKVFTYDYATLDDLDALGVPVAGVPNSVMPADLTAKLADNVIRIGSLFEPDYETVAAEQPDLVIVAGRSAPKYAELAKIAPTIDLTPDAEHLIEEAKKNLNTLGTIFGKEDKAKELEAKLDRSVAALKAKAETAGTGMLVMTTGGKMSTFGDGSRFGYLFKDFGVKPADNHVQVGTHGEPVSFEYILKHNPDWLFVVDRDAAIGHDGQSAAQLLDNDIIHQTKAWKNGHIVYLNAANWYLVGGGITALQTTVDNLTQAFDGAK